MLQGRWFGRAAALLVLGVTILGVSVAVLGCAGTPGSPFLPTVPCDGRASVISGSVVDATNTGSPVSNAYIHVPASGAAASSRAAYLRQSAYAQTTTGEDGRFELEAAPSGHQQIVVEPPAGSGFGSAAISLDIPQEADASTSIRVTLAPTEYTGRVAAVVVDPPDPTIEPGGSLQFTATVLDSDGEELPLTPTWVVTNGIGTIDGDGLLTGSQDEGAGTAVAIVAGTSGSSPVHVATPTPHPPTVTLNAAPLSGTTPLQVTAAATATDSGPISAVELDWGDGTTPFSGASFPATLEHIYTEPGSHTLTARAVDDQGGSGIAIAAVLVSAPPVPPTCLLVATPSEGPRPLGVSFALTGSDSDGEIVTWNLDFGDGSPPWSANAVAGPVVHTYDRAGRFVALLTVVDNTGASGSMAAEVTVSDPANELPTAELSATPTSGPAPLPVALSGTGTDPDGTIVTYKLDFQGDGTYDWESADPPSSLVHEYAAAGTYVAKLTILDDDDAEASDTVAITVTEPPALAVSPTDLDLGSSQTTGQFVISNIGGGTLSWTCTESTAWITSVTPASGASTGAATVSVGISRDGLAPGRYSGTISVSSNGGSANVTVWVSVAGSGELICFSSKRDGNYEIYVGNADGTNQVNVSSDPAQDDTGTISPDGLRVAFDSKRDTPDWLNIYVTNSDGSGEPVRLTFDTDRHDQMPAWSPDGTKLVFVRGVPGNKHIFTMNASDGSGLQQLTEGAFEDSHPAWCGANNKIAFASTRDGDWDLYTMNPDGSELTQVTNDPGVDYIPAWSPDGTRIAYTTNRGGRGQIWVMTVGDEAGARQLTAEGSYVESCAWSPGGDKIVYSTYAGPWWDLKVVSALDASWGAFIDNLTDGSGEDGDWARSWAPY